MKPDLAAWEPFEPTANDPWDLKKVAHFHRRAGFGASWAELHRDLEAGPDASVHRLLNSPAETTETQGNLAVLRDGIREAPDYRQRLQAYWMYRLVFDPNPLRENMTLFWHNHFATSNAKVGDEFQMAQQNELLRTNSLGDLRLLLEGVLSDAAMLIWLDATNSPKARPNENLAREFLELFTLGVGNYTEADVREAARALTGWVSSPSQGPGLRYDPRKLEFKVSEFDDGDKRIFGKVGRFGRADLVRLVLEQSACAVFISRKLYRHFVRDDIEPEPELIEPLADALRASGYSIRRIVGKILRSRHFYSESVHRRRIASPVELCVGLLRTLGARKSEVQLLAVAEACRVQGQHLFYPPNVAGWAGGRRWITSARMVARSNWLSAAIWGDRSCDTPAFDPLAWGQQNGVSRQKIGQALIDLLL
jgi:uncharacterized protein (DUF1800 family)